MTPDEFKDDAEFEAFLHGKGELAELLRAVPQPSPPAELDAAVLAAAETALATGSRAAANDAVIPPAQSTPPSFIARWRWPLGLAASVVLMIPIFMLQWQGRFVPETEMAAATPAPESMTQRAPAERAEKDADFSQLAKSDAAKQPRAMRDAAPRPNTKTKNAMPGAAPSVGGAVSEKKEAPAQAPITIAQAPDAGPQAFPQPAAPPPPAAAPASARSNAAPAEMLGSAAGDTVMAAKRAAPAPQSEAQSAMPVPDKPEVWLARIEKLKRDGTPRQTLDEWVKFKRAYPDYPVPKPLAAQIEELKKEPR